MEFTNEIFFNKPLTAGSTVIITYSGKLYREHSKDVSIVHGYGENWAETESIPMVETDNGFEVTINVKDYNTFNFCFSNSFNIWDNNSGFNYIAPISPRNDNQITNASSNEEASSSSSIDISEEAEEIAEDEAQVKENDEVTNEPTDNAENFENTETENVGNVETFENNTVENIEPISNNDKGNVEAEFSSLLDSLLDDTNNSNEIDISNLSGFGLQSVDEIKEEDIINCDKIFAELFEELTGANDNTEKIVENNSENIEEPNYDEYNVQELDSLMDNLLLSISEKNNTTELATPIDQIADNEDIKNSDLPALIEEKEDWVDKIINISYNFSKKVTTACKKFGALIKLKAKEIGLISDK